MVNDLCVVEVGAGQKDDVLYVARLTVCSMIMDESEEGADNNPSNARDVVKVFCVDPFIRVTCGAEQIEGKNVTIRCKKKRRWYSLLTGMSAGALTVST